MILVGYRRIQLNFDIRIPLRAAFSRRDGVSASTGGSDAPVLRRNGDWDLASPQPRRLEEGKAEWRCDGHGEKCAIWRPRGGQGGGMEHAAHKWIGD